jgi:hypothetical protein
MPPAATYFSLGCAAAASRALAFSSHLEGRGYDVFGKLSVAVLAGL